MPAGIKHDGQPGPLYALCPRVLIERNEDLFGSLNPPLPNEGERRKRGLQVLDIRLQFLEAHPGPSNDRLASSVAPKNPHPYAGHTVLFASHFKPIVPENVVLPRGCLDNRQRWMQGTSTRRGQVHAFNVMVSRKIFFNVGTGTHLKRENTRAGKNRLTFETFGGTSNVWRSASPANSCAI